MAKKCSIPMPFQPIHMDFYSDYLLITYGNVRVDIYHKNANLMA